MVQPYRNPVGIFISVRRQNIWDKKGFLLRSAFPIVSWNYTLTWSSKFYRCLFSSVRNLVSSRLLNTSFCLPKNTFAGVRDYPVISDNDDSCNNPRSCQSHDPVSRTNSSFVASQCSSSTDDSVQSCPEPQGDTMLRVISICLLFRKDLRSLDR